MGDSEDKARLISLGAERLADALLKLARRSGEALEEVRHLLASPEENLQRFRKKLAWLKRGRKFYDWRGSYELAAELEEILEDLRAAAPDPREGLELLAAFYACDRRTPERCDDSDGVVDHVFSATAAELFREFARRCEDKPWVADLAFRLCLDDDYGVRRGLLHEIVDYLPEEEIRKLANRFLDAARMDPERSFHLRYGTEILAKALNDLRLFERAALCGRDPPSSGGGGGDRRGLPRGGGARGGAGMARPDSVSLGRGEVRAPPLPGLRGPGGEDHRLAGTNSAQGVLPGIREAHKRKRSFWRKYEGK
ncbi:DUF6880 family protein [Candidatus Bipolaricaulota sp. J31]